MASISKGPKDPNGRKRILFVAPDGRRKTIRLGKAPIRTAEAVKVEVEHLLSAKVAGCGGSMWTGSATGSRFAAPRLNTAPAVNPV